MKIIFRSAAIAALLIASACGKDNVSNVAKELENLAEEMEKTPLEANTISDNVVITGATKEMGAPPTPNAAINLDVSNSSKTAFLNEGFEISLNSDADIVGAYLQFKSNDGTLAESYHDINVASNTSGKKDIATSKSKKGAFGLTKKVDDTTLDIDFNAQLEPGTFCYVVCIYDGEGNISAPSEVCVTVESWGGNSELVASWNTVKQEDTYNGTTTTIVTGVENCENSGSYTTTCNEETVTFYDCSTLEMAKLVFNSDGTYSYTSKEKRKRLNTEATEQNCEAVYFDELRTDEYKSDGNWAFVASESRLTLVEYSWSDTEDGVLSESETYEPGDGELIFDGAITIDGNTFTLYENYDDNNDGIAEESFKIYFEK